METVRRAERRWLEKRALCCRKTGAGTAYRREREGMVSVGYKWCITSGVEASLGLEDPFSVSKEE